MIGLSVDQAARLAPVQQKPVGISLCMIVKNEERFLDDCLRSVKGIVDEIIVVDTGSSDATVTIAASHGAIIQRAPWQDDFSQARNLSLAMASYRWILVLDADEVLVQASRPELAHIRTLPADLHGFYIRCYNMAEEYQTTAMISNAIIRIFPNNERIRYYGPIHEIISLDGALSGMPAAYLDVSIIHRGYLDVVSNAKNKTERNVGIAEKALRATPDDPFAWYNFGTAVSPLDGKLAIQAFQGMRKLNGKRERGYMPAGLMHLANMLFLNGDHAGAEEAVRECTLLVPTFANAHFLLGQILHGSGRYQEARASYLLAIAAGDHNNNQFLVDHEISQWKAYTQMAGAYMDEGNFRLGLAWCNAGLEKRPQNQLLRGNKARCQERLHDLDAAEETYRVSWERDQDEWTALDYAGFLARCRLYSDARDVLTASSAFVSLPALQAALSVLLGA